MKLAHAYAFMLAVALSGPAFAQVPVIKGGTGASGYVQDPGMGDEDVTRINPDGSVTIFSRLPPKEAQARQRKLADVEVERENKARSAETGVTQDGEGYCVFNGNYYDKLKDESCVDAVKRTIAHNRLPAVQQEKQRQSHCYLIGMTYSEVSQARGWSFSPQEVFKNLSGHAPAGMRQIPDATLKAIINQVYFDPGFVNAGGEALRSQMTEACLYPHGKYTPLK